MVDGDTQWTLTVDAGRYPALRLKDTTTVHHSLPAAALVAGENVALMLKRDGTQAVNVVYGEGVDEAGTVWRRVNYDIGIAAYQPLAIDARVDPNSDQFEPGDATHRAVRQLRRRRVRSPRGRVR
jgi:hypothetical protein